MEFLKKNPPLFSVVIATYNRAELLRNAIYSLCQQTLDKNNYEVLIVDNNSTDNTPEIVDEFLGIDNVRYIRETNQGTSHARNRGWQEAKGEYVAYIDDDCKVPEEWLEVASRIIQQKAPGIFGGPYYRFHNSPKPVWFKESYDAYMPYDTPQDNPELYLHGCNLIVQKKLLVELGGFNPDLGPVGDIKNYGEDIAIIAVARAKKPDILVHYNPDLYLYHLVRAEDKHIPNRLRTAFKGGREFHTAVSLQNNLITLTYDTIKHLFLLSVRSVFGILLRKRSKYPYPQNYVYEVLLEHVFFLGSAYAGWKKLFQNL